MANFYIVATPIGNLQDFSQRAVETLKRADLILCEDTRTTKKLLEHYQIKTPTLSYHQYSKLQKIEYIINLLKQGKNLALVSDAGTPGISDPGNRLVEKVVELMDGSVKIVPIPGPSALTCAGSISGFPVDKFIFMGFPPIKNKRKKFFGELVRQLTDLKYPVILYESPYRIIKTLEELRSTFSVKGLLSKIVVCRELTKKFETVYRGNIEKIIKDVKNDEIKGEFVIIIKRDEK
jgi:16S rRNA (cytidine1402-2'-O)-methyltransferase